MSDLFAEIKAQNFDPAPLRVLIPNNEFVRLILLQCGGELEGNKDRIGNRDVEEAKRRHWAFIRLVSGLVPAPAFVATPEYSTPWEVVIRMLAEKCYPEVGSIWLLGCESVSISQLKKIIVEHDDIFWWSEIDSIVQGTKSFLDPVLIVFRGVEKNGTSPVCIAIQFKNKEMGGEEGKLERDHLILGTKRYFLQNGDNSIRLVPLLCSDSLGYSHTDLPTALYLPHFYVHLQCTYDVFRVLLKGYRDRVYETDSGKLYTFLTLNWAGGLKIDGSGKPWHFGGSAIYQRPTNKKEPRQSDEIIDANHRQGIYLKFCEELRNASYYFSPAELVFDFQCTKADQTLSAAAKERAGVLEANSYAWKSDVGKWVAVDVVDDGVVDVVVKSKSPALIPLNDKPSSRERLISFSLGQVVYSRDWYEPHRARSFQVMHGAEKPLGTLVCLREEQVPEIDGALQRFNTLESFILKTRYAEPTVFNDLRGKKSIQLAMYVDPQGGYKSNILADGQPAHGAQIFIGDASEAYARQVLDRFRGEIRPNRASVWYRSKESIAHVSMEPRQFTNPDVDPRDYSETIR